MSWSRGGLGGEGICSVLDESSHLRKALPGPPGQHFLGLERERQLVSLGHIRLQNKSVSYTIWVPFIYLFLSESCWLQES